MSEGSTVDVEARSRRASWRQVLGVGVVAAAVGGAALLPAPARAPYEGASELIADAYASGDAEAFVDLWDDRFAGQFEDRDRLVADIQGLLAQGGEVVGERLALVRNVPLVVVETSDNIQWCVRPDGVVLPTCRLGDVDLRVRAQALGAQAQVLGGGLDLDRGEIAFELSTTSEEPLTLDGPGELVGDSGPWVLGAVSQAAGGQFFPPAEDGSLTLGGPFTLQVTLQAALGGAGSWEPQVVTWRVGGKDVRITIPGPDHWLT